MEQPIEQSAVYSLTCAVCNVWLFKIVQNNPKLPKCVKMVKLVQNNGDKYSDIPIYLNTFEQIYSFTKISVILLGQICLDIHFISLDEYIWIFIYFISMFTNIFRYSVV